MIWPFYYVPCTNTPSSAPRHNPYAFHSLDQNFGKPYNIIIKISNINF